MNEPHNYIIKAHKGFPDKTSEKLYRENSLEACRESGLRDTIGIIELDLRKSKDGILYCYHGTLFQYYVPRLLRKNFAVLKQKYGVSSLEEILSVIPETKIIFLDIKDGTITAEDIGRVLLGRGYKEIILGNKSVSFLRRFDGLPPNFVKSFNGNIFCAFYDLQRLKAANFKYFEVVFPFQITRNLMKRVKEHGLEFHTASLFFRSETRYWNAILKNGIRYVSSDFVNGSLPEQTAQMPGK